MRLRSSAAILAIILVANPAWGHSEEQLKDWEADWLRRVEEVGLTIELVAEWKEMAERHPEPVILPPQPRTTNSPQVSSQLGVEQWRGLVSVYFPPEAVDHALKVMACESGGNPWADNLRSTASGLFQHLASYWADRSVKAGWAGASIWDPEANIAVAAWLSKGGTDWSDWNASIHCWG